MEEKLRRLMKHEGLNSTRLAEILGIQASGISHIMSGRNKPSYDFLLKLLQRFPQINPDWLLLDKGSMYRDEIKNKNGQGLSAAGVYGQNSASSSLSPSPAIPGELLGRQAGGDRGNTALSNISSSAIISNARSSFAVPESLFDSDNDDIIPSERPDRLLPLPSMAHSSLVERIVVFYKDKTFSEYRPE